MVRACIHTQTHTHYWGRGVDLTFGGLVTMDTHTHTHTIGEGGRLYFRGLVTVAVVMSSEAATKHTCQMLDFN